MADTGIAGRGDPSFDQLHSPPSDGRVADRLNSMTAESRRVDRRKCGQQSSTVDGRC